MCDNRGYYERYAVPYRWLNALRARLLGRALLRLKPSRICDNRGYYERYAVPHHWLNALRARLLGGDSTPAPPHIPEILVSKSEART
jgi:hypothetical protein